MSVRYVYFIVGLVFCLVAGNRAYASSYSPDGGIIGKVGYYRIEKGDDLYKIARKFDLGITELRTANPALKSWKLKVGSVLMLPTSYILPPDRQGIVLNLAAMRLFYFADDYTVLTFPVGIGRTGWLTPTGNTAITLKRKNPVWIPPDSIRMENPDLPEIVPAGPDNPLGQYAMNLGWPGYRIHGTNAPHTIGKRLSHGCIRLYPEDIETLFRLVNIGTPVKVIDAPFMVGWQGNNLWLEVLPRKMRADTAMMHPNPKLDTDRKIYNAVHAAAGPDAIVDWASVQKEVKAGQGMPVLIGRRPD